jgi:dihydrofolate synthase / folylpolyglutamate synthase
MALDHRAWLEAHINLERGVGVPADVARATAPTLDRMRALIELLGSPQLDIAAIHLTGTNGKTSTARITAALLRAFGLKVGTYTSPNLERINDRMSILDPRSSDSTVASAEVTDARLDQLLDTIARVEPHLAEPPSYFEILTAAALYWFADEAVDVAVLEVGLGGTWDATNVVDGRIAVITNIAVDHVEYLGPTRESIATDKAGIVKPDSLVVLDETDRDLQDIFRARPSRGAIVRPDDFDVTRNVLAVGGRVIDCRTPRATYEDVFLALHGAHQADNAATALAAAEAFVDERIPDEVVGEAFASVTSPGRLEVVGHRPLVLLDGAHNVAGAEALRAALDEEFTRAPDQPRTLVFGQLGGHAHPREMLSAVGIDDVTHLVVCRPASPRAHDPAVVAKAAEELGFDADRIDVADTVREGVGLALLRAPDDAQVVVTGSLYVVGEARSMLVDGDTPRSLRRS